MKLKLIVAMCNNMGIGYKNSIPWHIKKDLIHFSNKTSGVYGKYIKDKYKYDNKNDVNDKNDANKIDEYMYKIIKKNAIVMGKNTWMSLPKYPDPLPNRDNIIISNTIHTQSANYDKRLLNMNNEETLSMVKIFYDMIYYAEKEESDKLKKRMDFMMYFSSIPSMIDYCMTSDKLWDNIFDFDEKTDSDVIEIEMSEARQVREINQKSCIEIRNEKLTENLSEKITKINNISDTTLYDEVWIIGGAQIYNSFISENNKKDNNILINEFCITYIDKYYECDTFFPKIENMNLYYISYFLKCENMDDNIGKNIPVYYITFTIIDLKKNVKIEKKTVEIKSENIDDDQHTLKKYYYYVESNTDLECENMFITNENAASFLWCITELPNYQTTKLPIYQNTK